VGTGTLSIAIAGSGITINAIATDDKVNKLESAGFNITGRGNVGEDVTLTFSSGITLAGTNTVTVNPFALRSAGLIHVIVAPFPLLISILNCFNDAQFRT
jgi:hypothetical protein